jgi:hypothetical protein
MYPLLSLTIRWSRPGMRGEKTYPASSLAAQLEAVRPPAMTQIGGRSL